MYIYIHTCVRTYVCIYDCMYACIRACIYAWLYVRTYLCMYVCRFGVSDFPASKFSRGRQLASFRFENRSPVPEHQNQQQQTCMYVRMSVCMWVCMHVQAFHHNDVIMTTIASWITTLTIVYSTVYSDADQRKHQSSASLAFLWDRWIPRTKGQLRGRCFHLMTSSCMLMFRYGIVLLDINSD